MTPHKQQIEHDPENGKYGDCLKTAIASVLELPLDVVPNFNGPGYTWSRQNNEVRAFAKRLGLGFATMLLKGSPNQILTYMDQCFPGGIYLMSGTGARGVYHTVVCEGRAFLHDPHPSNEFLTDTEDPGQEVEVAFFVKQ